MTPSTFSLEYQVPEGDVLVSRTDLEGIITYCNNAFIEASGYSREELIGSPHNILRHPDMPRQAYADLWETIRSNKPWRGLIKNRRKDGGYYWTESDITPFIEDGVTTGYVSFRYKAAPDPIAKTEAAYRRIKRGSISLHMHEGKIVEAENWLVRWLNASSIKFRIAAFMTALFSTLAVIGAFNLHEAANAYRLSTDSLEATRMESYALDTARIAEMDFQEQLQSWKDLLITGGDPQQIREFERRGATFEDRMRLLKTILSQTGLKGEMADEVIASHIALTKKYRDAIASHDLARQGQKPENPLHGADLATAARIETIVSAIQDAQQNRLRDLNFALEKSHRSEKIRAIVMLVVAAMVGLFLSMRFVVSITQPIRHTTRSLKKVVKLQQHFLNIILKLEVYRDRIDEEQRVGNFIMSRMTEMDSCVEAMVRRYTRPAEHLSGDVLIAAFTPSNTLHILLADAIGHGLTAAINVLPLCQTFYDLTHKGFGIDRIAADLNRMIHLYMPVDRFVSAALISIDRRTQVIEVWNGGIPAMQLFDDDGRQLKIWESQNLPLGILPENKFPAKAEAFRYRQNCQLCLFSDGLAEATSGEKEQFGSGRIAEVFGRTRRNARFDALIEALELHLRDRAAHDDISLAVVNIESGIDTFLPSCRPDIGNTGAAAGDGWKIALSLTADELRYMNAVPLLTKITAGIHATREHNCALFLMLSELFDHALNHGALGLEPHVGLDTEGYEKYLTLRDARLDALDAGTIELEIENLSIDDQPAVRLRVACRGSRFAQGMLAEDGIAQTRRLSSRVEHGKNEVVAYYICA